MIIARIEFDPDQAWYFLDDAPSGQNIVEMEYDNVYDLIEVCEEFKDFIINCTVLIDGKIVDLHNVSRSNASS